MDTPPPPQTPVTPKDLQPREALLKYCDSLLPEGQQTFMIQQVMELLKLSFAHITDLIEERKLIAVDLAPGSSRRTWRIFRASLVQFLAENSSPHLARVKARNQNGKS